MNLQLNKVYSFDTLVPSLLGATFKNATVIGMIDYQTALNYINPDAMHARIFPYLPTGTVNDPTKYTYIIFKLESDIKTVLAYPWINETSIRLATTEYLKVTIKNAGPNDTVKIRNALVSLGYTELQFELS